MNPARIFVILGILAASPAIAPAQVRFTQPIAEMGELRGGPAYQHRFDFINDSTQSIEILDIRLGCGCLQPLLDKRTFAPGEKGTLVMNLRTLGQQAGPRSWRAYIQYRQGDKLHETSLVVAATLRNEVTVEPSILAMNIETTLRQEVMIKDHRAKAMKITAVQASSSAIRLRTHAMEAGMTKVIVEVSAADLTRPRQEGMLSIVTDDPDYRQLQIPITLTKAVRADVTATPERVEILGNGSQLVRLRGAGDRALRLENIESDHPAIKCVWASGPGNDATIKIIADATKLTSPSATTMVRVRLTEPAGASVTIPVVVRKE